MGHKARAKEVVAGAGVPVLPSAVVAAGASPDALACRGCERRLPAPGQGLGRGRGPGDAPRARARASWPTPWPRHSGRPPPRSAPTTSSWSATWPRRATSRCRSSGTPTAACCTSSTGSARCSAGTRRWSRRRPPSSCPTSTRRQMWEAAVAAARAVDYVGVGTVEYLVDAERLLLPRDEHPAPGRARRDRAGHRPRPRRAAAGGGLRPPPALRAGRRRRRGHAVEVRLCAERPREDYRPTPGTATHVRWPEGPGLRVDGAIESGSTVSAAYDSLVAKLMAHGRIATRPSPAVPALRALELDGLETNRELLGAVLDDAAFRRGEADVHYLEHRPDLRDAALPRRRAPAPRRRGGLLPARRAGGAQPGPRARRRAGATSAGRCTRTSSPTPPGRMEVRAPAPDAPACVRVDAHVARSWARPPTARRRGRPAGRGRAAAALPRAPLGPPGRGQRPRGSVDLRPAHRGRLRRARRHRRRMPRPATRCRDQGPRRGR